MTKSKKIMIGALPFAALIVLFAVFCGIVSSKGYRLDKWPEEILYRKIYSADELAEYIRRSSNYIALVK